ncbi:MAG: DUF2484 family protein [Roseivivax sp.]|nr:DUF2484 family protein [Roseivivax sp.]
MSVALIMACFWVLAASAVAMLPAGRQRLPALALMVTAPLLVSWVLWSDGLLAGAFCAAGAGSVMRRPLAALLRRIQPARA